MAEHQLSERDDGAIVQVRIGNVVEVGVRGKSCKADLPVRSPDDPRPCVLDKSPSPQCPTPWFMMQVL